jgi:hypothetical protein
MTSLSTSPKPDYPISSRELQMTVENIPESKRQATYIKVIDLAQSYNINPEKIKGEIDKLNTTKQVVGNEKEDSHSTVSKVTDDSDFSGEKRHQIVGKGPSNRPGKKFFSPINGGFNMCL